MITRDTRLWKKTLLIFSLIACCLNLSQGERLHAQAVPAIPMVLVEGGSFSMGNAKGFSDERPAHQVKLDPYLIGIREVTQAEFRTVMNYNPSRFSKGPEAAERPVERVSWYEAAIFCNELSLLQGLVPAYYFDPDFKTVLNDYVEGKNWHRGEANQGWPDGTAPRSTLYYEIGNEVHLDPKANGYSLPTEAQWEYAALGGMKSKKYAFIGGARDAEVSWTRDTAGGRTQPVGRKAPNELGIFDMGGNVWEWCSDGYAAYPAKAQTNPRGPSKAAKKVQRGGSWVYSAAYARAGLRLANGIASKMIDLGFRVVKPVPASSP